VDTPPASKRYQRLPEIHKPFHFDFLRRSGGIFPMGVCVVCCRAHLEVKAAMVIPHRTAILARHAMIVRDRRAQTALLLLVLGAFGAGACSPSPPPSVSSASTASTIAASTTPPRDRGRTPAETMSYRGADWLTRPERIAEEQPDEMLAALHLAPGMSVADIGAGVGYHALRMATIVGAAGRVYATDVQPEMLTMLREEITKRHVVNIVPVLSGDTATGLPAGSIDLALMVDVYHELGQPERFLAALKEALKPGGRLVLVEFRGEDPSVPIKTEHKMTAEQAMGELATAGFTLVERQEFLPWQHLLIFAPRR
jgi:protein-L-isoaspartate O-methyltransferase